MSSLLLFLCRWGVKYHFTAEVTEKDTDVKINGAAPAVAITRNPIKLEIVEMKSGYKPYIPSQKLQIKATTSKCISVFYKTFFFSFSILISFIFSLALFFSYGFFPPFFASFVFDIYSD